MAVSLFDIDQAFQSLINFSHYKNIDPLVITVARITGILAFPLSTNIRILCACLVIRGVAHEVQS